TDLTSRQVEDAQLVLDIPVMVREGGQHQLRLHPIEYRPLLPQDPLDPMGDVGIGVDQVADDLQHAPPPGDGPRDHLLAAQAGDGGPESVWPPKIGAEQGGLIHPTLSSFGYGRSSTISVKNGHPETGSDERRAVLLDERLKRHGRPATELLDQVVRAREDSILVVDRDLSEMLEQEGILAARILPARLQGPAELLEVDLLVLDVLAEDPAQDPRGLLVRAFDRAEEGIDLPLVGSGVLQDAGDDAALVLGGDRGVLAGAERHVE